MLKEKYSNVLALGEQLAVRDGYVEEEEGVLRIGGNVEYALEKDLLWDAIKTHSGWETEVDADIKVLRTEIYGLYTVAKGDTLWKIADRLLGKGSRYMEIFEINKDILSNPDLIKIGQELKLPNKS